MKKQLLILFGLIFYYSINAQNTIWVTNDNDSGSGSLREAIGNISDGEIIRFHPDSFLQNGHDTILLFSEIPSSKSFSLIGYFNNSDTLFVSGDTSRLLNFNSATEIVIDSMAFINGYDSDGGAIMASYMQNLIIRNSLFQGNIAHDERGYGGAVFVIETPLVVENSTFTNNYSEYSGGAIACRLFGDSIIESSLELRNSIISNNPALEEGGGIAINAYTELDIGFKTTITDCEINYNETLFVGGGLYVYLAPDTNTYHELTVNNSSISNNISSESGGAIGIDIEASYYSQSISKVNLTNSTLMNNYAELGGAVIAGNLYNYSSSSQSVDSVLSSEINIINTTISKNENIVDGGSVINLFFEADENVLSNINCVNSTISENLSAVGLTGGAINVAISNTVNNSDISKFNIHNSTIYHNTPDPLTPELITQASNSEITTKGSILLARGEVSNLLSGVHSLGYNIFSDSVAAMAYDSTDFVNQDSSTVLLGELMDNGGSTFTHLPAYESVAIDGGDPNEIMTTQNGRTLPIRSIGSASPEPLILCPEDISYCSSRGYFSFYDWNESTDFNDNHVVTGNNNGYLDNKNDEGRMINTHLGGTVDFELEPGFAFWQFTLGWRIFVDWNQNGQFTDANEIVYSGFGKNNKLGSFTVPSNVGSGCYAVRVSTAWASYPAGCSSFYFGEVEDYLLNVSNQLAPPTKKKHNEIASDPIPMDAYNFEFVAHNNLINQGDELLVTLRSRMSGISSFTIYDHLGRNIQTIKINHVQGIETVSIPTTNLKTGSYLLGSSETVRALQFVVQ
jgi:predicted outer membrane repeat protein